MRIDSIGELAALLEQAGVTVTFSQWCRSGIVGRELCVCWRCRGLGGPGDTSFEEMAARSIDWLWRLKARSKKALEHRLKNARYSRAPVEVLESAEQSHASATNR